MQRYIYTKNIFSFRKDNKTIRPIYLRSDNINILCSVLILSKDQTLFGNMNDRLALKFNVHFWIMSLIDFFFVIYVEIY